MPTPSPKQVLVVDTNILWSDKPFRDSVPWTRLLSYAKKYTTTTFVVPEVVVHELARQESDRIAGSRTAGAKALGRARTEFARAGISFPEAPSVRHIRGIALDTRQQISQQMRCELATVGIVVAAIPDTTHETLVSWSLDGHPPFDSTDKGYRDALIWRTVCDVAAAQSIGATVLFVTDDNDYTQKPPTLDHGADDAHARVLHEKLAADLNATTTNTVTVARSLREAVDLLRDPQQSDSTEPRESAESDRGNDTSDSGDPAVPDNVDERFDEYAGIPDRDDLLRQHIESACDQLLGEDIGSSYDGPGPKFEYNIPSVENATVSGVTPDLSTMTVDVHERFEGDTVIGDVRVEAEILYEGYVSKADAYSDAEHPKWTVSDWDWNEHYALVEGYLNAELQFQFVTNFDDVTLEFDHAELYE